jgi:hypothetical protein
MDFSGGCLRAPVLRWREPVCDGKLHSRAGVVLDFADGRRWSSAEIGDFRDSMDPQLLAFLIERVGLPLRQADTEMDIHNPNTASMQSGVNNGSTAR